MPSVHQPATIIFHLGSFPMNEDAGCRVRGCGVAASMRVVIRADRIAVLELCSDHAQHVEAFVGSGCRRVQLARQLHEGFEDGSVSQNFTYAVAGMPPDGLRRRPSRVTARHI